MYLSPIHRLSFDFLNGITIEAWVNPATLNNYGTIVDKGESGIARFHLNLGPAYSGALHCGFGGSAWTTQGGIVAASSWNHVALTYDKNNVKIYVEMVH